jgi:hypothetical protein
MCVARAEVQHQCMADVTEQLPHSTTAFVSCDPSIKLQRHMQHSTLLHTHAVHSSMRERGSHTLQSALLTHNDPAV